MYGTDLQPLSEGPAAERIQRVANNRLGAVYSALYSFWSARHAAVAAGLRALSTQPRGQEPYFTRRDSYSVLHFADSAITVLTHDVASSPDQLLDAVLLGEDAGVGTNFATALRAAEDVMVRNWNTERTPIMIFLSDGECTVSDAVVRNLCHTATRLGKPLSFQSVSFSPDASVPVLQRMAEIALEVQVNARQRPGLPAAVSGPRSSFTNALNTVDLTEAFLGFAESMRKPRGSLVR